MIDKLDLNPVSAGDLWLIADKIDEIIDHLNANVVQCSCPPWYRDYVKDAHDSTKDSLHIRGCGWTCPIHGEIRT